MSSFVDGDPSAPIMVVGMAPGREEIEQDRPFVGASGAFLWRYMARAGMSRADCYILNTIGEWPLGSDGGPTSEQYSRYWDAFDSNVRQSSARVVLLLGGHALWRFTGLTGGIEAWRGYLLERTDFGILTATRTVQTVYKTSNKSRGIKKGDPRTVRVKEEVRPTCPDSVEWIVPTLHPAGIMRTGFATTPAFAADIARLGRALRGTLKDSRTIFTSIPQPVGAGPVAFDIETGMLDGAITRVGIAGPNLTFSAPWDSSTRRVVSEILSNQQTIKIAHNMAFDLPRLQAERIEINGPLWDTMLGASLIQPDLYKGLNPVASLYLDRKRWKHLADDEPAYYNANDASATLELYFAQHEILVGTRQVELFTGRIMPCLPTLTRMSRRGVRVSESFRDTWLADLRTKEDDLLSLWHSFAPNVNPASPKQLRSLFYDEWELNVKNNKYGGISTDELAMRTLAVEYPDRKEALDTLIAYKDIAKLRGTYAETIINADGCVHPSFLPASKDTDAFGKGLAGTWRITSHDPNLQNQPKIARKLFIPHDPNMVLVSWDYNQLEARLLACLAHDDKLQAAIEAGLHDHNMQLLSVDKTRAKNGFFGWAYGAGAKTLRMTFLQYGFNVPFGVCKQMLETFNTEYVASKQFRERMMAIQNEQFYVENPFGLRRYWYRHGVGPAAANQPIQSSGAIMSWIVLPMLDSLMSSLGGNLLLLVHDEYLVECPKDKVKDCLMGGAEILERAWPELEGLRVPTTPKIGSNWGEMEEVKCA